MCIRDRKYNGCNDRDEDGIYDSRDACPNLYGAKTNRGCPINVLDSDLDGLTDAEDDCPFLKGLAEHKGCPDTDQDGLSDKLDQCPFLKGNTSNNGCPSLIREENNVLKDDYIPIVHVTFDTDQYFIKPMFWSLLDDCVNLLLDRSDLEICISGHTDWEGDAAYNFALGQSRSLEVMNYFIERGISSTRISIISYGETKPVDTNQSVYGKAKNRRAEILLLRQTR